jgi:hypothetical protein
MPTHDWKLYAASRTHARFALLCAVQCIKKTCADVDPNCDTLACDTIANSCFDCKPGFAKDNGQVIL